MQNNKLKTLSRYKNLMLLTSILFSQIVTAEMNWKYKGNKKSCLHILDQKLNAVTEIFCSPSHRYSKLAFCQQLHCLINFEVSHCDEQVQEAVKQNNISLMQMSDDLDDLIEADWYYCTNKDQ